MGKARKHGSNNSITDVSGVQIGNYTDETALSGVTVVMPHERSVAGVDVRGGAPGTRETDLLNPVNLVQKVDAIVLSGGSAFGLSTCDGVMKYLEEEERGYTAKEDIRVPIVPAAIIFDLYRGEVHKRAKASWGYEACMNLGQECPNGNIGAGSGAVAGNIKGGLGTASEVLSNGVTVGAVVAVNSAGYVADPKYGGLYARYLELESEFAATPELPCHGNYYSPLSARLGENTVIAVVATDVILDKTECTKVAQMAQDGLARAIQPSHTLFDGDTVFSLSTGEKHVDNKRGSLVSLVGSSASDVLSRAIIHAVLAAESTKDVNCYREMFKAF